MTRFTRASAPRHAIYFELFTDAARQVARRELAASREALAAEPVR